MATSYDKRGKKSAGVCFRPLCSRHKKWDGAAMHRLIARRTLEHTAEPAVTAPARMLEGALSGFMAPTTNCGILAVAPTGEKSVSPLARPAMMTCERECWRLRAAR